MTRSTLIEWGLAVSVALVTGITVLPAFCDVFLYFVHGTINGHDYGQFNREYQLDLASGWLVTAELVIGFVWLVWATFQTAKLKWGIAR